MLEVFDDPEQFGAQAMFRPVPVVALALPVHVRANVFGQQPILSCYWRYEGLVQCEEEEHAFHLGVRHSRLQVPFRFREIDFPLQTCKFMKMDLALSSFGRGVCITVHQNTSGSKAI